MDGGTQRKLHLDGDRGPGLGAIFIGEKGNQMLSRPRRKGYELPDVG